MYIRTSEGLGQTKLPSADKSPCWQDEWPAKIVESAIMNGSTHELTEFHLGESKLRTKHRAWIKNIFVPAILKSWQTTKPIRTISLIGYADSVGNQLSNYNLGLKRAKAVRQQIIDRIQAKRPDLLSKIKIEVFSQGECWNFGKKQRFHRRVSVAATSETFSPEQSSTYSPVPSSN